MFFLVPGTGTVYVDAKQTVIRRRRVADGFKEELTVLNHADEPIDVKVRIEAASDFADLFEVKDALEKKGSYSTDIADGRSASPIGVTRLSDPPSSLAWSCARSIPTGSPSKFMSNRTMRGVRTSTYRSSSGRGPRRGGRSAIPIGLAGAQSCGRHGAESPELAG